ncbi:expressed unknown protein [Seminavis robusta]|uniref:Uncharacterized protein n=1 Tax=Seminavis robusta TaxID=568900 RepID=A0A9N8H5Z4_9STRA|nr:expressed unknown protein [Seminavis robusta]|eukprot:Sro33_g021580.1 n/a (183) ;mRNA; r:110726-111274
MSTRPSIRRPRNSVVRPIGSDDASGELMMSDTSSSSNSNGSFQEAAAGRRSRSRSTVGRKYLQGFDMAKLERAFGNGAAAVHVEEDEYDQGQRRRQPSRRTDTHQRFSLKRRSRVYGADADADEISDSAEDDDQQEPQSAPANTHATGLAGRRSRRKHYRTKEQAVMAENWYILREALGNMA